MIFSIRQKVEAIKPNKCQTNVQVYFSELQYNCILMTVPLKFKAQNFSNACAYCGIRIISRRKNQRYTTWWPASLFRLELVSEIRCSNRTDSKTKTTLRHDIKVEELPDNQKSLCRFILNLLFPSISIIIY